MEDEDIFIDDFEMLQREADKIRKDETIELLT